MENATEKRYYVDFYDMIDGWETFGFFPEYLFDDLGKAEKTCDELNSKLGKENKDCGEHYGVIDVKSGMEIYCGLDVRDKSEKARPYYVDIFKDGDFYTLILSEGENFETLTKMKENIAYELRDKLNEILPEQAKGIKAGSLVTRTEKGMRHKRKPLTEEEKNYLKNRRKPRHFC